MSERVAVRFGTTLAANLVRGGLTFLVGLIIARGLGASGFGDLNFLLGSFAAISQLLEAGTSSAFYTFVSRRRQGKTFFVLYLGWMAVQFAVAVLAVGLLLPGSMIERIWVGHERGIVLLTFFASFMMTQIWGMVSQLGEAMRKTVVVQGAAVGQAVVHFALIAAAMHWEWLTVQAILWLLMAEYAVLAVVLGPRLVRENYADEPGPSEERRAVLGEFAAYCKPLVVYGWVGFLYAFADRWLLQEFGGSEQQGFFAVGQQFANISLIATLSVLKVFWKEIAEAREQQDHQRVRKLYVSVSRGLYFTGAWISCLLIPYSREILAWTLGPGYEAAWLCLTLMFLFPVHQSLGQIQNTFFYASGETGSYARIGLLMMGISIPVTYFVLASESATVPGLGLGSVGLAMKMVGLQIVGVNLQAYVIARSNGWEYAYGYQGAVLATLLGLGLASRWVSTTSLGWTGSIGSPVGVMLVGCSLYAGFSLACLSYFPSLAGLTRDQIKFAVSVMRRKPWPGIAPT